MNFRFTFYEKFDDDRVWFKYSNNNNYHVFEKDHRTWDKNYYPDRPFQKWDISRRIMIYEV